MSNIASRNPDMLRSSSDSNRDDPFDEKKSALPNQKINSSSSDSSDSSSSQDGKSSPPSSTPPSSPESENVRPAEARVQRPTHSARGARRIRRNRRASQNNRLGAIDEDTDAIAPDVPTRNPNRLAKLHAARLFSIASLTNLYSRHTGDAADLDTFEKITGPNGEKLTDVRNNAPEDPKQRRRRKRNCVLCLVLVAVVLIALIVGLAVGLTRPKHNTAATYSISPGQDKQAFPLGTWEIPTYLISSNTSCTPNPSTFRCYPFTTYSSSSTTSYTLLSWQITSPTNKTTDLLISSLTPAFSYSFMNTPLTLTNNIFEFAYNFTKTVIPTTDITNGSNIATRCYFDNTLLTARLYATSGLNVEFGDNSTLGAALPSGAQGSEWPYAVEYNEVVNGEPRCYEYVNGQNGQEVDIGAASAGAADCGCEYRNFNLS